MVICIGRRKQSFTTSKTKMCSKFLLEWLLSNDKISCSPMSSISKQLNYLIATYVISYTVDNKAPIQEWQYVFILITGYKTTKTQIFKPNFSINTRNAT